MEKVTVFFSFKSHWIIYSTYLFKNTESFSYETMSVYMSNSLNRFIQNTDSFYEWVIESIA